MSHRYLKQHVLTQRMADFSLVCKSLDISAASILIRFYSQCEEEKLLQPPITLSKYIWACVYCIKIDLNFSGPCTTYKSDLSMAGLVYQQHYSYAEILQMNSGICIMSAQYPLLQLSSHEPISPQWIWGFFREALGILLPEICSANDQLTQNELVLCIHFPHMLPAHLASAESY